MRVLVAGATGVIGRQLLPLLRSVGHDPIALVRPGGHASAIERAAIAAAMERTGIKVVVADALDREAVFLAVRQAAPDAIVNMLTAIPAQINPRRLAKDFEQTNRLRTIGTSNLIEAGAYAGVRQLISQGLAYAYDPQSSSLADEDAPFWRQPPKQFVPVLAALKELEQRTSTAGGLVLRFGHLYGPGTAYARDGFFVRQVLIGKVPLVGGGTATFSFTHVHDAATAIVAALAHQGSGALNIVDDEPAPVSQWLPVLADILMAKARKAVPAVLARMVVGGWGVAFMTQLRGADNSHAKEWLDWHPRYASWRTGFGSEFKGQDGTGPSSRVGATDRP